jgi:hypothetical protein
LVVVEAKSQEPPLVVAAKTVIGIWPVVELAKTALDCGVTLWAGGGVTPISEWKLKAPVGRYNKGLLETKRFTGMLEMEAEREPPVTETGTLPE